MDEYDVYLPPSVRNMLELGMTIDVGEMESCPWPALFIDATEKYSSQVQLAEKTNSGFTTTSPACRSRLLLDFGPQRNIVRQRYRSGFHLGL